MELNKPLTKRALVARVSQKLKSKNLILKKCRPDSDLYSDLGDYYLMNLKTLAIETMNVDLQALANELGINTPESPE